MPVATYGEVVVNVAPVGNALVEIKKLTNRYFALLPLVSSILPTSGSIAGGTKLTIQGSGFTTSSKVMIGAETSCTVIADESSYTKLVCTTPAVGSAVSGVVKITQSGQVATCTLCDFDFADASTPSVTNRSETTTDRSSVPMVINGSGFGNTVGDVTVTVGTVNCVASNVSDTTINCDIGRFAAGDNNIVVHIAGKGNAKFSNNADSSISNPALVDSLTPSNGSTNGGTKLTITGNGFVSSDVSVKIDGTECPITSSDFGTIICTPAAHSAAMVPVNVRSRGIDFPSMDFEYSAKATPSVNAANPTEGMSGDTLRLTGTRFGTFDNDVAVTVGGVACTVTTVSATQVECTLGSREGGTAPIAVNVGAAGDATVSANFSYILSVSTVAPLEGSYGGGQLLTVSGQGFSNNTVITVCGNACMVASDTNMQVVCHTPSNDNSSATTACDIKIANGDDSVTHITQYEYKTSLTPKVTSVSPSSGGTAGGTRITITGSGFQLNGVTPTVKIDGSICDIESSTDTSIVCVTNAHTGSKRAKVAVTVGTNGIATQEVADFYYIDKWSSIFTWGGTTVPTTSDFVVINKGQTVLLDTDTAVLKMLLINGGELIFDEKDVSLKAENILITNQGKLQVGTEDAPFQHKAIIEMHGHLRSQELPIYGAKTLALRNGTLDLHGKFIPQTWSKLASTAEAGATQITLEHSVTWQVNDEIVIATTGLRHSQSQTEKRSISAISADGRTLNLTAALNYKHLGVSESFGNHTIHFRAEVGLLTRNIVFRGSDDHVWHDDIPACPDGFNTGQFATQTCFQGRFGDETGADQFGASIMMHAADESKGTALARIEGIEATYVGQAFRLGRYPIHFHLMGEVEGMYVRRCSIHRSFNRAVTIHGTHNLTVEHNVVYDVMGGAIFIEDGIETNNVIQYNLAIFVKQSTSLLNDDVTPAAYWVTNPNNIIRHNHAAGGTHFGAWYRMHTHPDGPSFTPSVCQKNVELGQFENNTVHSQGWFGLWIFQDYFPKQGGRCGSNVPSPAHFRSLTTWNCEKGAEWVNGGALQFIDFFMVNNEVAGMDLHSISGTKWGEEKGAVIKDAVIVGYSSVVSSSFQTNTGIVMPMNPKLLIDGAEFYNFNRGGIPFGVGGSCSLCGGYYYWTQRLSFTNANRKFRFRWEHEAAILDRDGTLTGKAWSTLVPASGLLDPIDCEVQEGPTFSSGVKGAVCDEGVDFHRFALNSPVPTSLNGKNLIFTNQHGNSTSRYLKKRLTHTFGKCFKKLTCF
uniref:fibrocystin-L-like n=1 Tax=Ciona intestinalis TaxID=7719 RepID=UPI000EF537BF|nr:fibrocystin-L-like [Ciona intestinalis]|eukprot:XP_018672072.2 fibrocystin-L-like [Ciona intestinalis]